MTMVCQLTLWELLDEAILEPDVAKLEPMWSCLDEVLEELPLEQQLQVGGEAIARMSEVLDAKAEYLLEDWEQQYSGDGPVVRTELFAGLVRRSVVVNWDELKENSEKRSFYRKEGGLASQNAIVPEDSIAAVVEKEKVIAMVDAVLSAERLRQLVEEEEVERWQRAIAQILNQRKDTPIQLMELQQCVGLPLVVVWLSVLLGEFRVEQWGEFYNSQTLWVA